MFRESSARREDKIKKKHFAEVLQSKKDTGKSEGRLTPEMKRRVQQHNRER